MMVRWRDGIVISRAVFDPLYPADADLTCLVYRNAVPGTFVKLTVIRRGVKSDVKLKRISSESLAERRRIFELINETKNESVRIRSPVIHGLMEQILQEWSDQLKAQSKVAMCAVSLYHCLSPSVDLPKSRTWARI